MPKKRTKPTTPSPNKGKKKPSPRARNGAVSTPDLGALRTGIDAIDRTLVDLLNERARLVVKVGEHKRKHGVPVYAPHREAEVLDNVLRANRGPLPNRALEGVFRELMSGSFKLELPIRVGYLGPQGSYSHVAAVKHFGSSIEHVDLRTIEGVFTEVRRGHVDYGFAPVENSIGGGIVETLDAFQTAGADVIACAEVQLEVHHALLANCAPAAVRRIHSKPEVFDQCRHWLATQYPHADLIPAASSSRAAQVALEETQKAADIGAPCASAAIGSALAGQLYGLNVLFERIEDNPGNVTRFLVLGRHKAKPSGDDKTSIMFSTPDTPGALVQVLSVFDRAGINLTHIDKRPSGRVNWTYTFFIDAVGHETDRSLARAIESARMHCKHLQVLGSYPRARRIL
jgi:chorismate mutase/prephenate dehydratase